MEFSVGTAWTRGRRIVDVFHLANQMDCTQCKGLLDLRRTRREKRVGLASVLDILCSCGNVNRIHTDRRLKTEDKEDAYLVNALMSSNLQMKIASADLQHILDIFCIPVTLPFNAVTDSSTPSPAATSMTPSDISDSQTVTPGGIQSSDSSSISRHHSNDQQISPTERAVNIVDSYSKELSPGSGERIVNSRELTLTSHSQTKTSSVLPEECFQVRKPELLHLEENDSFRRGSQHATELCVNTQGVKVDSNERDSHPVIKSENDHCNGEMTTSDSDMMTTDSVSDLPVSFCVSDVPVTVSVSGKTAPAQSVVRKKCKKSGKSGTGSKQKYNLEKTGSQLSDVPLEEMIKTFPVAAESEEPGGSQSTSCNDSTPKKRFQCRACDKWFTSELKAYSHVTCHTDTPYLRCFRCGKDFNGISRQCNVAVLEAHLNEHDGVRPYVCEVCAKTYQSSRSFRQHMTKIHDYVRGAPPNQDRSLSCQQCSFHATSRAKLTAHIKVHTGQRKRICDICGMILSDRLSLKSHKNRRHDKRADEYLMACHLCEKRFRVSDDLNRHLKSHRNGDVREYLCEFCPKAFKRKTHLTAHERIHTGKKPYQCPLCEATFVQQTSLDWHTKKHFIQ